MPAASVFPPGITATTGSTTRLELGVVVVVVVLFAALLLVRARQARDQRIRKAASEGYYDPDVAHYVHGPVPDAPAETPADDPGRSLAPTFVAPTRNKAPRRGTPVPPPPRPMTATFGAGSGLPPRPVPAFDPAGAVSNRPLSAPSPSAPPAPPPPAATVPGRSDAPRR